MNDTAKLDSAHLELVIIPGDGLLAGQRVGVSARVAAPGSVGVLVLMPGELERREPVSLLPLEEVPVGTLVLGEDLASRLGLRPGLTAFRLDVLREPAREAESLTLEVTVEGAIDRIAAQLSESGSVLDRLIQIGDLTSGRVSHVELDGNSYKVRGVTPLPEVSGSLYRVTSRTRIELFSPSAKVGVDIVVLADTSGSMSVQDLTDDEAPAEESRGWLQRLTGSRAPVRRLSRAAGLRKALHRLREGRLRATGVVARLALVGFDAECRIMFPRTGGMAELNRETASASATEFGNAIDLLAGTGPSTEIARALLFAAELLHRHGHQGNERLIVLLSDGANWTPKGEDQRGEVLAAIEDPVSMMEHLSAQLGIRLHAIGISNEQLYQRWLAETKRHAQGNQTPNHELLERLVEVSGGDPSRTGDVDVLNEYLGALGSGVTSLVPPIVQPARLELSAHERGILAELGRRRERALLVPAQQAERSQLADRVLPLLARLNEGSLAIAGQAVFRVGWVAIGRLNDAIRNAVTDRASFNEFVLGLWTGSMETVEPAVSGKRHGATGDQLPREALYPIAGVRERVWGSDFRRALSALRNYLVHDPDGHADPASRFKEYGAALQQLTGKVHLVDDDSESWFRAQLALLRHLVSLLEETHALLCASPRVPDEQRRSVQKALAPKRAPARLQAPSTAAPRWRLVADELA